MIHWLKAVALCDIWHKAGQLSCVTSPSPSPAALRAAAIMSMRRVPPNAPVKAYPAARAPIPRLSLPAGLVDDVVRRAVQLAFRIQLDTHRCNQLLTSRVVAALSARTRRFALILVQPHALGSGHYMRMLHDVLNRLSSCAAAETCELRLSLQLQQLDLTGSTITQPKRPESGAVTLANLFHGVRLQHLSLDVGAEVLMPGLQPLAQHLTQLHVQLLMQLYPTLTSLAAALGPLQQLQLPGVTLYGQEQLDALLAATQLTSVQLNSVQDLSSSRADAPCSWQRLELTHWIDSSTAAYLPLHSLTQPLLLVHNLTQACKFWRQLVQLMPSVTHITCWASEGVATAAMLRSLRLMVKQPWSRILQVCIKQPSGPPTLPACWKHKTPSQPGKLRVWFE
ncbi:hypothetical protein HaLaN_05497 [Haematococcus lacustris]|uniref:F-box domain-containing protein n=1 Tax=Haematococcus lacustris TaxID=44745 RepID=A0A699YJF1_HAELA|nr:hypothetical protein HaLaN_05497 [Haematococcus lacustris]